MPPSGYRPTGAIRHHHKRRTGCLQCKKRRIKCDESKPGCNNCQRSSSSCVYVAAPIRPKVSKLSPQSSTTHFEPQHELNDHKCCQDLALPQTTTLRIQPSPLAFSLEHMELLHHWSTSTSLTISRPPEASKVWSTVVTQIVLKKEFALSVILAFTARHLARLKPTNAKYYDSLALELQIKALRKVNDEQPFNRISKDNCNQVFIFAGITWMNTMVASTDAGAPLYHRSSANWITLQRGLVAISNTMRPWLLAGDLGPILCFPQPKIVDTLPPEYSQIDRLLEIVPTVETESARLEYTTAIEELRVMFYSYHTLAEGSCWLRIMFTWLSIVPDGYIERLLNREPVALIIFAHYAVLLSRAPSCWWLEKQPEQILASIYADIGTYYQPWLWWPMEQIGWVPERLTDDQELESLKSTVTSLSIR